MTTSKSARRLNHAALVFAGAVVTGLFASAAMASDRTLASDVPSVQVRYDDLNLATDEGVKALHRRIAGAARQVCAQADARNVRAAAASRACQSEAIARATQDVSAPLMAAAAARRAK